MTSLTRRPWLLPSALILLSTVPVLAGGLRIGELASGAQVTAENARFFADPIPVVVHIIGATTFCLLGAFQFSPYFRRRWPRWHRVAGRIVASCGLTTALSGMYMAVFYQEPADVGALLTGFRLVFGSAMAVSLVLGFVAILRRDVVTHRAWMIRGYAIGLGAGTQLLTVAPWTLLVGPVDKLSNALLMLAGWLINIAVAEWVIRRSVIRRARIARARQVAVMS
ncbi:MAG TPA: DUF2306 domain-containing protein [Pseudonocardiaceae bacterium]|nr:DUF2306 domain-containing protein [Pseudonocardiaceae bacterium]